MTRQDLSPTPGQTVGPFFGYALPYEGGESLVPAHRVDAVRLHGTVYDGAGQPVPDALIEIWQPDGAGEVSRSPGSLHRDGYTFTGWGRSTTDRTGHYSFTTVEPGASTPGAAPFFCVTIFARGLMHRLLTRAYVPESDGLAHDPLLTSVPAERRPSLIARRDGEGNLVFDIHLQGDSETVFLSYNGKST